MTDFAVVFDDCAETGINLVGQVLPKGVEYHVENLETQYWLQIRRCSDVPSN